MLNQIYDEFKKVNRIEDVLNECFTYKDMLSEQLERFNNSSAEYKIANEWELKNIEIQLNELDNKLSVLQEETNIILEKIEELYNTNKSSELIFDVENGCMVDENKTITHLSKITTSPDKNLNMTSFIINMN